MAAEAPPTGPLSEWLQLMLGEMRAKREALEAADAERLRRSAESRRAPHADATRARN